jgi:hypothetical protein
VTFTSIDDDRVIARPPPHNLEAEESLLGAMLLSKDATAAAIEVCGPEDFYKPAHGHIFRAIVALFERGEASDAVTVLDELTRSGLLASVGDPSVLISLQANTPSSSHAVYYAGIVAAEATRRRRLGFAAEIVKATLDGDDDTVAYAVESLVAIAGDTEKAASSWSPVELFAEDHAPVQPQVLVRSDGMSLLYRAKTHAVNGESESGKTQLALATAVQEVNFGNHVVYIDFEADVADIAERLVEHGCVPSELDQFFHYIRPEGPLDTASRRRLEELLAETEPTLVVIDGVAEALALHGWDENDAGDVTKFMMSLPRLCSRSGAAVLMLDHLVKDRESQGRYARGSGAKLAGIDGAAFKMVSTKPFARGLSGAARLEVVKDRHGHVRALQVGRTVAEIKLVSLADGGIRVEIHPPDAESGDFRPTNLMEKVSRVVELNPGFSVNEIKSAVPGNGQAKALAIALLVTEEYLRTEPGARSSVRHFSVRPYRESGDE